MIQTTNLNVGSDVENAQAVTEWLNEKSTNFFDSITCEETTVTCAVGDSAHLQFTVGGTTDNLQIRTDLGGTELDSTGGITRIGYGSALPRIVEATQTEYGIVLYADDDHMIFITKSDRNSTCVHVRWKGATVSASSSSKTDVSSMKLMFDTDLENSPHVFGTYFPGGSGNTSFPTWGANITNQTLFSLTGGLRTGRTAAVNCCFSGDTYAPHMIATPYSQFVGMVGTITYNGKKYVYDGRGAPAGSFALKYF